MGELLEIIKDRLFREFKVGAEAGRPQIAYCETFACSTKVKGALFVKPEEQGNMVTLELKVEPGLSVVQELKSNAIIGGAIPKEFIEPTLDGIREAK